MQVELLYFDGCPNWQETEQRLREAMVTAGCDVPVEHVHVTTAEQAERLSFRGSPTVLVDGVDPLRGPGRPGGAVLPGVPHAGGAARRPDRAAAGRGAAPHATVT